MRVHVFVEGGGDPSRTLTACRKAFRTFFEKALGDSPHPRISACGSRDEAHKDFCRATRGTYHKTRHGFPILERINPTTVRACCPHPDALLNLLATRLRA